MNAGFCTKKIILFSGIILACHFHAIHGESLTGLVPSDPVPAGLSGQTGRNADTSSAGILKTHSADTVHNDMLKGSGIQETTVKPAVRIITTSKLLSSIFVLILGWLALKYITLLLNMASERWAQYRLTIKGFVPVFRIAGWTALIYFVIIGIIRPPVQSVLALTASAGIAIGFASQDILKNIFGGIVILLDKPFKVGDKILIDTHYGEVIHIGLRTVRLVTPDDSQVAVPNSEIMNRSVSNANSGEPDCHVAVDFYFDRELDLDRAHALAVQCAYLSRYTFLKKPVSVVFRNEIHQGRSLIHMKLKVYVFDHRFEFACISDLTKIVLREFRKTGLA
ncbi:mechanosensitive ion channel [bacterium]|nr:mechanosensitive ion channel [bacterium]